MAEAFVGVLAKGCRSFRHQAGAPNEMWTKAIVFTNDVRNPTKRKIDDTTIEPLLHDMQENDEYVEIFPEHDRVEFWPSWGCQAIAFATTGGAGRQTLSSGDHGWLSGLRQNTCEWNPTWCVVIQFRSNRHPVKEIIVSKETAFPMMDSNVRIEDLCGFLTEEIN